MNLSKHLHHSISLSFGAALLLVVALSTPAAAGGAGESGSDGVDSYFGSFGTEVPIALPGFRGLEPTVKLVYASTSDNGEAGVGWRLQGSSYIGRASPQLGTPRYDATDRFVLDGVELVPCTDLGGTHCAKIQNYHRISYDAGANEWNVWRKDGTRGTYRPEFETPQGTFRWALSSLTDTRGNSVSFAYWCDGTPHKECYLDTISYNGAAAIFHRELRPDPISYATGVGLAETRYRLKSIDVQVSGQRARAYALTYADSSATSRSLLTSVQQFGRDAYVDGAGNVLGGSALPAMTFGTTTLDKTMTWAPSSTTPAHFRVNNGEAIWFTSDFNGDGKTDLAYFDESNDDVYVGVSDGNGVSWSVWSDGPPLLRVNGGGAEWFTADVNGDGKGDLLFFDENFDAVWAGVSTGSSLVWSHWGATPAYARVNSDNTEWLTGDFDGNGLTDLAFYEQSDGPDDTVYVGLSNGSSLTWSVWSTGPSLLRVNSGSAVWFGIDVDGDRDTDIAYYDEALDQVWVGVSDGQGSFTWSNWGATPQYARVNGDNTSWWSGDFNGDGRMEIGFYEQSDGPNWTMYVGLSTGSSLTWTTWSTAPSFTRVNGGESRWMANDYNGDGRTDVAYFDEGIDALYVALSNGSSFDWAYYGPTPNPAARVNRDRVEWFVADFDGDGLSELGFYSESSPTDQLYLSNNVGDAPDLLSFMSNGLGGTTEVEYTPSSAWSNTFLPLGVLFQTVGSVTTSDGRGGSSTSDYQYEGGLWSDSERRFLGFRRVVAVVDAAGNYTETFYHQHVGCISKPEVTYFRNASGDIYSYSQMYYQENATAPYTSLMTERWDLECNLDQTCRRVVSQLAYDTYGNVLETREYGDYDLGGDERTTVMGYVPNTSAYIVGLAAYKNIYDGIGTGGQLMRQQRYVYDQNAGYLQPPTVGNQTRKQGWNSTTGQFLELQYAYDGYGNLIRETDAAGSSSTYSYDPTYHLFWDQVCDALGHCQGYSHDPVLQRETSFTNPNGKVETYAWDALGRPLSGVRQDDGASVSYLYLDWGDPALQRTRTAVADGSAKGLWVDNYQDGLGRTYRTVRRDGSERRTIYNEAGRVWKESAWYFPASEAPQYQVYAYDGAGRVVRLTNPDGTYGETIYGDDYVVRRDELGKERVSYTDGRGQVLRIDEHDGGQVHVTTFEYDAVGKVTATVDALGNVSSATWDSQGRQLASCTPDTGCELYAYDNVGRVVARTDAAGQTVSYTYDALGRQATKTVPGEGTTTWTYDEPGHGASIGQLTRVDHPGGSEELFYNALGRRSGGVKCVQGVCYDEQLAYDGMGRLASITYPDQEQVSYSYDAMGRLATVSGYVNAIDYNARGQITSVAFANGTTQSYSYDAQRAWLAQSTVNGAGGALYQVGYQYDAAARVTAMTSTTDSLLNLGYSYDGLDRLIGVSGAQTQSFAYDALGRMTYNSEVGSYTYGSAAHVHAVTQAGGASYAYDANGNMISGAGRTLTWDAEGRLTSVTVQGATSTFAYDAAGARIAKTVGGETTRYFGARIEQKPDGTLVKLISAGSLLVARKEGADVTYYHTDHLGSVQLLTDAAGEVVKTADYAAFGETLATSGSAQDDRGFGGHREDVETGLIYMNARYYDASLGRFVSADTMVPDGGNPQAYDRYAFAYNNPISNADPSGNAPVAAAIIGAAIGVATGTMSITLAVVAVAAIAIGYVTKNPLLMSIGQVALGFASGGWLGGVVAALTSPISPLDPTIKQVIGWAYTAYGLIRAFSAQSSQQMDIGCTPEEKASAIREYLDGSGLDPAKYIESDTGIYDMIRDYPEGLGGPGDWATEVFRKNNIQVHYTADNGAVIDMDFLPGVTETMTHVQAAQAAANGVFDPLRWYTGTNSMFVGSLVGSSYQGFMDNVFGAIHDGLVSMDQYQTNFIVNGDGNGGAQVSPLREFESTSRARGAWFRGSVRGSMQAGRTYVHYYNRLQRFVTGKTYYYDYNP